jgi:hypothetical protein
MNVKLKSGAKERKVKPAPFEKPNPKGCGGTLPSVRATRHHS